MSTAPSPVLEFFRAANAGDSPALLATFTANAVLYNGEEGTYRGSPGIKFWNDKEFIGANCSIDITSTTITGSGETIVAGDTKGDFPGNQMLLFYHFTVEDDRIGTLTIHH